MTDLARITGTLRSRSFASSVGAAKYQHDGPVYRLAASLPGADRTRRVRSRSRTGQSERLRREGSIVKHLEDVERNDGYKGFNREGIDSVLRKLDPRAYLANANEVGS